MAIATRPKPPSHLKKRQAGHHRQSKHYLKAYWPYLPMLMTVGIGLMINSLWTSSQQVLGATSNFSNSALLETTNNFRAQVNEPALTTNAKLTTAAQAKANDLVSQNYWSHLSPNGQTPWNFISSVGYNYQLAGENLAYGFDNANSTVTGWMNSTEHRANILNANYQEVGFGVASSSNFLGKGPEVIVVAEYGRPAGSSQPQLNAPASLSNLSASIARIQIITGGHAMWSAIALSILAGAGLAIFITRHGLRFKKLVREGESYVTSHPLFDIMIVVIVTAGFVLTRTSGIIH